MSEPSSRIDPEARKILRKWARCQYYVYLRPLDVRFLNPSMDFDVHWAVSVEYRGAGFKQHRGQGMNLSEVIKKLAEEVPLRKPPSAPRAEITKPTEIRRMVVKKSLPTKKAKKGKKKKPSRAQIERRRAVID